MIPETTPLWDPLEKEWDKTLFDGKKGLAPLLGWRLCYHTLRAKGSQAGFPDRVLVRYGRVIFAELKRELTGKPSVDRDRQPSEYQREWLNALAAAGSVEVYLWRPSDLEEIVEILGKNWTFAWITDKPKLCSVGEPWTPKSAWWDGSRTERVPQ